MQSLRFRTNLRCESCLAKIKPVLEETLKVRAWDVDLSSSQKILTIAADAQLAPQQVITALAGLGYQAEEVSAVGNDNAAVPAQSYFPLVLILSYIVGAIAVFQLQASAFDLSAIMGQFMGAFFIVFSFFKLLNLRGFADAYASYDVVAKRWRGYGFIYPWLELLLGVAYWAQLTPLLVNTATAVLMGISSIGVLQSLMQKKAIRCACLGTVFNLPMSVVTLFEDLVMLAMALAMIFIQH